MDFLLLGVVFNAYLIGIIFRMWLLNSSHSIIKKIFYNYCSTPRGKMRHLFFHGEWKQRELFCWFRMDEGWREHGKNMEERLEENWKQHGRAAWICIPIYGEWLMEKAITGRWRSIGKNCFTGCFTGRRKKWVNAHSHSASTLSCHNS